MKITQRQFTVLGVLLLVLAISVWAKVESVDTETPPPLVASLDTAPSQVEQTRGTTENSRASTNVTKTEVSSSVVPSVQKGKSAPELALPSGFSNSEPFRLQDIIGKKVILLSFENYTSKNSLRTIPYLNQWYHTYKDKGLFMLTVHVPRFAFDRSKSFVDGLAYMYSAYYPIVLDNQFATVKAWGSTDMPTHYLVDINGKIAGVYKGEGNYESIEAMIRQLLIARSTALKLKEDTYPAFETPLGLELVSPNLVQSPETFFGSVHNDLLGNGTKHLLGLQDMKTFSQVLPNTLYLSGSWEFTGDSAKSSTEGGVITYKYNAKNVYAVLGSLKITRVRVTIDGHALGANAGKDIREEKGQSYLYVNDERLYDIVRGDTYGEHIIEMTIDSTGLEAYALQFG